MLENLNALIKGVNVAVLAGALMASSVLVLAGGNRLKLPGGVELRGGADRILENTGRRMSNEVSRTVLQKKISQADMDIGPEYFAGLQFALPVMSVAAFIPPALMGWVDIYWCVLIAIILYLAPGVWLNRKVSARVDSIKRDIPDFCLLLGNALKGADLLAALEEVAGTMRGELAGEINRALMDMATGDSRAAALNKMALRCGIPELTGLVGKIQQAIRYGSPLEPVVKHHAEKILARRKQETQKVAGELTIKLLFPIVAFVLLPFLILIGFPILWNILMVFGD
ncbi:MAG: type II secretion system F family protein [Actinobacteria bacterium]|nr:type II secretion system F family protein [Actinomycetota bacterium]